MEFSTYYHSGLANCHAKMGDRDTAISYWREALKLNSEREEIRMRLVDALFDAGKYEEVVDEALLADRFYNYKKLGEKLYSVGAFDAAIHLYDEILMKYSNDDDHREAIAYYYSGRGDCHKGKGEVNKGLSDYRAALNCNRRREDIRWRLIGELFDSGRYKEASKEAFVGHVNNTDDMKELASKLCSVKAFEEAFDLLDNLLKNIIYKEDYYKRRGKCYILMGELDEARSNYEEALKKDWAKRNGLVLFCQGLFECGKIDEALKEISLLDMHHLNAYDLRDLGDMLMDQQIMLEKSHFYYTHAIEKAEYKGRYYWSRGIYYKKTDDTSKAIQDFQEGCKADDTGGLCCIEWAEILLKAEEYEEADKALQSVGSWNSTYLTLEDVDRLKELRKTVEDMKNKGKISPADAAKDENTKVG